MLSALGAVAVVIVGLQAALFLDSEVPLAPASWAVLSVCVWLLFVLSKGGWAQLSTNDTRRFAFGVFAAVSFLHFLQVDSSFKGWSSVYYFCGEEFQYCTCNFRWNVHGWLKAIVLWQFVLSATLGAQQLIIQAGLGGLLPGEEAVTRESFISICWRLIPYWLNNWEQQWGAEVSSMTFELPHFAVELLIILPCCQIICSRLKVLVTPQVNVLLGPGQGQGQDGGEEGPFEDFAPNVLQGFWERRPEQRRFLPRVRSNMRVLVFLTGLTALAALNATLVPTYLEGQAAGAPASPALVLIGRHPHWLLPAPAVGQLNRTVVAGDKVAAAAAPQLLEAVEWRYRLYGSGGGGKGCADREPYARNVAKHAVELQRMQDPEHRSLVPLVESALAIMRLSCEKYFVLLAIYLAFLLFRDAPRPARAVIRLVARVSSIFQKVILFAFPVVCWLYNAGVVFSLFVSVVFWGGPLLALYDTVRSALREVSIKGLSPASREQVERMGGSCAICWGDMAPKPRSRSRGSAAAASATAGSPTAGSVATSGVAPHLYGQSYAAGSEEAAAAGTVAGPGALEHCQHRPNEGVEGPAATATAAVRAAAVAAVARAAVAATAAAVAGTETVAGTAAAATTLMAAAATTSGCTDDRAGETASSDLAGVGGTSGGGGGGGSGSGSKGASGVVASAEMQPEGHIGLRVSHNDCTRGQRAGPMLDGKRGEAAVAPTPGYDGPPHSATCPCTPSAPGSSASAPLASGAGGGEHGVAAANDAGGGGGAVTAVTAAGGAGPGAVSGAVDAVSVGWALPCGHAYHHSCLTRWMEQCSSSGATPTCPMCQRGIQLQVRWCLPRFLRRAAGGRDGLGTAGGGDGTARLLVGGGAAAAAAAGGVNAAELAAGEELLDAVRHFAGRDAGLQVVGLLEHQRELHELLYDAPALEFGELLREVQPLIVQQAAQELQHMGHGDAAAPAAAPAGGMQGQEAGAPAGGMQGQEAGLQDPGSPHAAEHAQQACLELVAGGAGEEAAAAEAAGAAAARGPLAGVEPEAAVLANDGVGLRMATANFTTDGGELAEARQLHRRKWLEAPASAVGQDGSRSPDCTPTAPTASCVGRREAEGALGGQKVSGGPASCYSAVSVTSGTAAALAGPRGAPRTAQPGGGGGSSSSSENLRRALSTVTAYADGDVGHGSRDCGGDYCERDLSGSITAAADGMPAMPSAPKEAEAASDAVASSAGKVCRLPPEAHDGDSKRLAGSAGPSGVGAASRLTLGAAAAATARAAAAYTAHTALYGATGHEAAEAKEAAAAAAVPVTKTEGSEAVARPMAEAGNVKSGSRADGVPAAGGKTDSESECPSECQLAPGEPSVGFHQGAENEAAGRGGGGGGGGCDGAAARDARGAPPPAAQEPYKPRRRLLFWRRRQH